MVLLLPIHKIGQILFPISKAVAKKSYFEKNLTLLKRRNSESFNNTHFSSVFIKTVT